jgi:uncharacterized membrane protein YhaH (DUF805 family)
MDLFLTREGRIGRGQWWLGVLGLVVAQWVVFGILGLAGLFSFDPEAGMSGSMIATQIVIILLFIWPMICVYGKRYHDRDKSAWWILIVLIPFIGWLWQLIELGLLRGTEGPNRFGPDPLG